MGCTDVDDDGFGPGCARGLDCDDSNAAAADLSFFAADIDGDRLPHMAPRCSAPGSALPPPGTGPAFLDCDDSDDTLQLACGCTALGFAGNFRVCSAAWDHPTAARLCGEVGRLAVFSSPGQQDTVAARLVEQGLSPSFVAGSDVVTEGRFVDENGAVVTIHDAAAGEPDGGTAENCLRLAASGIEDASCTEDRPAVCLVD